MAAFLYAGRFDAYHRKTVLPLPHAGPSVHRAAKCWQKRKVPASSRKRVLCILQNCCFFSASFSYFRLSATATATATVAPTMGLLPIEIRRFIRQKPTVLFCFCSTFERFLHLLFSFLFHFSLQSYYFFATVDTRLTNQHFSTALDKCNSKDILLLSLQFLVL